jgi:hypothetical protein
LWGFYDRRDRKEKVSCTVDNPNSNAEPLTHFSYQPRYTFCGQRPIWGVLDGEHVQLDWGPDNVQFPGLVGH